MLKKAYRIGRRSITKNALVVRTTPFFRMRIQKNDLNCPRFAFIVSKKIDKRAVVRNTLRRKVSSCVEENLASFPSGYDMIVSIHKNALMAKKALIYKAFLETLQKVDLV